MARQRPNFNRAARALIQDVAASMREFSHIKASRILVVAGEARRASRGTVKPLMPDAEARRAHKKKPVVRIRGRKMLYCITLRPLFFRKSTAQARIETLLHELFHIADAFDGTLDPDRRHRMLGRAFRGELAPLVRRYLRHCPPTIWDAFSYNGEVKVYQWLERPPAWIGPKRAKRRKVYTDEQLFLGTVRMVTRGPKKRIH